jgi:hypothetical protein
MLYLKYRRENIVLYHAPEAAESTSLFKKCLSNVSNKINTPVNLGEVKIVAQNNDHCVKEAVSGKMKMKRRKCTKRNGSGFGSGFRPSKDAVRIQNSTKFIIKNYISATRSFLNNQRFVEEILDFIKCDDIDINTVKKEFDKFLIVYPKFNRGQLLCFLQHRILNKVFEYFLRFGAIQWIFSSARLASKETHLKVRTNMLSLCLNASNISTTDISFSWAKG